MVGLFFSTEFSLDGLAAESAASTKIKSLAVMMADSRYYTENNFSTYNNTKSARFIGNACQIASNIYYVDASISGKRYFGVTGSLVSDTAEITIQNTTDMENIQNYRYDIDYSQGYMVGEDGKLCSITEGRTFITQTGVSDSEMPVLHKGVEVCKLTVTDQGQSEEYTLLINSGRNIKSGPSTLKDYFIDDLKLYNGESNQELDSQYQFAEQKQGPYYGITQSEEDYTGITLPDSINSIKIKPNIDNGIPTEAYFSETEDMAYTDSTFCVSINGGEWTNINKGELSPELILKQGWNVIQICIRSIQRQRPGIYTAGISHVMLIYREGASSYTGYNGTDVTVKKIEAYQAAPDSKSAANLPYQSLSNTDGSITMYSGNPYVFVKITPTDSNAKVAVTGATEVDGGYLLTLNHNTNSEIPYTITPANGDENNAGIYTIPIQWQVTEASLGNLEVSSGGSLDTAFDKKTYEYYLTRDGKSDNITITYTPTENTTVKVYADRKEVALEEGSTTYEFSSNVGRIEYKVIAGDGTENIYKIVTERTQDSISETTKNRAKEILEKALPNFTKNMTTEQQTSFWTTVGLAAAGDLVENGLNGSFTEDVTTRTYKQATDYGAVIIEMIMCGENPYNFLGTNYVQKLMECSTGGQGTNFGDYANNIYALKALDMAGYNYDKKSGLVNMVYAQAKSATFDLDMRGWALAALYPHYINGEISKKQIDLIIDSFKDRQRDSDDQYSSAFDNLYYLNANSFSHGCAVSGLAAYGVDIGSEEWAVDGVTPLDVIANYQIGEDGKFIYKPYQSISEYNPCTYIKDIMVALGDVYNGESVYVKYVVTEDKYAALVSAAEELLKTLDASSDDYKALSEKIAAAKSYVSSGPAVTAHGQEYYDLLEVMQSISNSQYVKPDTFMGSPAQKEAVEAVKKQITDLTVAYENKTAIAEVQKAYEALAETHTTEGQSPLLLQYYVNNSSKLTEAVDLVAHIDEFIQSVEKIGKVSLDNAETVTKAAELYDALTDKEKAETIVQTTQKTLADAESVLNVMLKIAELPEKITLENAEAISAISDAYQKLSSDLKAQVSNSHILMNAKSDIKNLQAVDAVAKMIEKLTSASDEADILAAQNAYDMLTEEQKKLVEADMVQKLEAAAKEVSSESKTASVVKNLIDNIKKLSEDEITLDDEDTILNLRAIYDSLSTDEIKAQVTNYEDLVTAEEALKKLMDSDIVSLTKKLPKAEDIQGSSPDGSDTQLSADEMDAIKAAVTFYNTMTAEAQTIFQNEHKSLYDRMMAVNDIASTYSGYVEEVLQPVVDSIGEFVLPVDRENQGVAAKLVDSYKNNASAKKYLDSVKYADGTTLKDKIEAIDSGILQTAKDIDDATALDILISELPKTVTKENYEAVEKQLREIDSAYAAMTAAAQTYVNDKATYDTVAGLYNKYMAENVYNLTKYVPVLEKDNYTYTGKAFTPNVSISGLKAGTDFKVAYKNNVNVGTATVTITGMGNYTGTITKNFKITAKSIAKMSAKLSKTSYTYTGKSLKPAVSISGLKAGNYTVTYKNNIKPGTAAVVITGKGNYTGTITKTYTIKPVKTTSLKASAQKTTSLKLSWKKVTGAKGYQIYQYDAKAKAYKKVKTVKTNSVTIKKLKAGTAYKFKVRAYVTGKNCGAYSSVIKTATKPVKVTSVKTSKVKKTSVKLSWKKVKGATGYKVYRYDTKAKKWKAYKTVKTNSVTVSKLKAGTTYKFKVQAYKTYNKKTYKGSFSSPKKVTTKKK